MLKLAADENFNGKIVRGLLRRNPHIDIVRVQDSELYQAADPDVLEWAASENRLVLTHDIETMNGYALARVRAGLPMPGLVQVEQPASIGQIIEDLSLIIEASLEGEWEGQILYLPLR
jgi:hypothetical protein